MQRKSILDNQFKKKIVKKRLKIFYSYTFIVKKYTYYLQQVQATTAPYCTLCLRYAMHETKDSVRHTPWQQQQNVHCGMVLADTCMPYQLLQDRATKHILQAEGIWAQRIQAWGRNTANDTQDQTIDLSYRNQQTHYLSFLLFQRTIHALRMRDNSWIRCGYLLCAARTKLLRQHAARRLHLAEMFINSENQGDVG